MMRATHPPPLISAALRRVGWCVWLLAGLVVPGRVQAASPAAITTPKSMRFALIVGHNKGDSKVKDLRYAQRDASRFAQVLQQLGGFQKRQIKRLHAPSASQLRQTFRDLKKKLKGAKQQGIFVFFFSGHSREGKFLLGNESIPYQEVTKFVQSLPVRFRLLIVDSCFSGRIASAKGARRVSSVSGFRKHLIKTSLQELPIQAKGYAVLASSGANERSYESERLRSSFFTASLLLGLRGAADRNQDQRISLSEAYTYARDQTIRFSGQHKTKLQRPVFFWKIKGDGPLILTQLKRAETHLALARPLRGYCLLWRQNPSGPSELVHEFNKSSNQQVTVGVRHGRYQIQLRRGRWIGVYNTTLQANKRTLIKASDLKWHKESNDPGKGPWEQPISHLRVGLLAHYAPMAQLSLHGFGLSGVIDLSRWMRIGLRYQMAVLNPNGHSYISHGIGLPLSFGYGWELSYFRLWLGTQIEPRLSLRNNAETQDTFANVGLLFMGNAQLDWTLTPYLSLRMNASAGLHVVFFYQAIRPAPAFDLAVGLVWQL